GSGLPFSRSLSACCMSPTFYHCLRAHGRLHSFPTRRSSDLATELFRHMAGINIVHIPYKGVAPALTDLMGGQTQLVMTSCVCPRSEEHTSELQSRENLVCRLLLEKKKGMPGLKRACLSTDTM